MKKVYKIQAAFVKNKASTTLESREGYHFWRLIQEIPNQQNPEVLEVFEPHLLQAQQGIVTPHWYVKTEVQNVTEPNNHHIVYGGTGRVTDVQARWERAKEHLRSQSNSFHFNHLGPLDRVTQYAMQNVIYNELAQVMGIEAHPFIENSLFKQQIASQELLFSYEQSLLLSSNLFTPHAARYKIVSAINYDCLKTIPALDMTQLHKGIHTIRTAHHFWMLTVNYGGSEKVIEVVQGLPTKRTKAGTDEITTNFSLSTRDALLSIYTFSSKHNSKAMIPAQETKTAYEGENAAEIWQCMKSFIPILNGEQVPYSFLSLGTLMLWGGKASNGNSAYASIGFIFETLINDPSFFKIPRFEGFSAPGITNPILSRKAIQEHFDRCSASPTDSLKKIF